MAKEKICPLLNAPCVEHDCKLWIHVQGVSPVTGKDVDVWDCSLAWLPVMMLENASHLRKTNAAMNELRGDVQKQTQMFFAAMSDEAQKRVAETPAAPQLTGDPNAGSDQKPPQL